MHKPSIFLLGRYLSLKIQLNSSFVVTKKECILTQGHIGIKESIKKRAL